MRRIPSGTIVVLTLVLGAIALGLIATKFRKPPAAPTTVPATSPASAPAD